MLERDQKPLNLNLNLNSKIFEKGANNYVEVNII